PWRVRRAVSPGSAPRHPPLWIGTWVPSSGGWHAQNMDVMGVELGAPRPSRPCSGSCHLCLGYAVQWPKLPAQMSHQRFVRERFAGDAADELVSGVALAGLVDFLAEPFAERLEFAAAELGG